MNTFFAPKIRQCVACFLAVVICISRDREMFSPQRKNAVQSILTASPHDGAPRTSERNASFFFSLACLKLDASHFW